MEGHFTFLPHISLQSFISHFVHFFPMNTNHIVTPVTQNRRYVVGSIQDGTIAGTQWLTGLFFHDLGETDAEIIHQLSL